MSRFLLQILAVVLSCSLMAHAAPKKIAVSAGVMQGNLLVKTQPQYPAIAKAARIEGTVMLKVLISTEGAVEEVNAVSGPPELQQAAIDAVKRWRYKPYLLKGEPMEVESRVNVPFKLPPATK